MYFCKPQIKPWTKHITLLHTETQCWSEDRFSSKYLCWKVNGQSKYEKLRGQILPTAWRMRPQKPVCLAHIFHCVNRWEVSARSWRKLFSWTVTRFLDEKEMDSLEQSRCQKSSSNVSTATWVWKGRESRKCQATRTLLENCKRKLNRICRPCPNTCFWPGEEPLLSVLGLRFCLRSRQTLNPSLEASAFLWNKNIFQP